MMVGPMIIATGEDGEVLSPPDDLIQLPAFSTKRAMEFSHLQHFKRLIKSQLPDLQFRLLGDGADPPDFFLSRSDTKFGLELTMFASAQRRERAAFFSKLHERLLLAYGKGRLRGLSGIKVDMAFGELGAKPVSVDDVLFDQLIEAFDKLGKQKRPSMAPDVEIPSDEWPNGTVGPLNWYASSYADYPFRGSKLSNIMGFEVEYMHRQWTTTAEVERAINERIMAKDRAGVDELLIVAGGPDQAGRQFPAEAILASHLLEKGTPAFVKPAHIQRVFIDVWGAERLYLIHDCAAA
ncbi:MAG: hypothetical protein H7Z15_12530 [Rhizobacter sp.]|nr:hypothetical protein [Rhizobacter sp.]